MSNVRCANCGNLTATLQIGVEVGGDLLEESAVCALCVERIERQAMGPLGPLAPHALLARLMVDTEEPSFHCPSCGYDVENLVRTGKLGCQQCYESFDGEVRNLLRRAVGRDAHRGKLPPLKLNRPDPEGL